jgi:hypothetical protein
VPRAEHHVIQGDAPDDPPVGQEDAERVAGAGRPALGVELDEAALALERVVAFGTGRLERGQELPVPADELEQRRGVVGPMRTEVQVVRLETGIAAGVVRRSEQPGGQAAASLLSK